MNNEMMYALFLNSIKNMNDDELAKALEKAKGLLNENDHSKLVELINKEASKHGKHKANKKQ